MRAHKLITFWFEKVTSNLCVMLKSLVAKNVSQHKLLVGDLELNTSFSKSRCTPPKRRLWKLSNPEVRLKYGNCIHESAQSFQSPQNSDSAWTEIKTCLLNACNTLCGWTRGGKPKRKKNIVVE